MLTGSHQLILTDLQVRGVHPDPQASRDAQVSDFPGTPLVPYPNIILIATTLPNPLPGLQDPHSLPSLSSTLHHSGCPRDAPGFSNLT